MLYIRADANSKIGSGHIMRCISIAKSLRKIGIDSIFITADNEAEGLLKQNKFDFICLDTIWDNLDHEIDKMEYLITQKGIKKILVDSYFVSNSYLSKLKQQVKLIYLDDLHSFIYPVDMLVNYGISAEDYKYETYYKDTIKLLIGSSYIPLRDEFAHIIRRNKERVRDILITTGGSDSFNFASKLIYCIRKNQNFNTFNLHVVVGAFNKNKDELINIERQYDNIILYHNVTDMSNLMMQCDVAISAGGTTLYELCACGAPTISFVFADNQIESVNGFEKRSLLYNAGDFRSGIDECLERICGYIEMLDKNYILRNELSNRMMKFVDGKGADRIAQEILIL
jgi:UDP-2,4-diacetamido-2,4,6-trideoxy-beta-L-altropyranose hydrolase